MKKSAQKSFRFCSRRFAIQKSGACLASGALAFLICACHATKSRAGDATWLGTTSNDYNVGSNWSGGTVPFAIGTATFNGAGNGNTTLVNANTTINRITFDTVNVAAYTIGTSANTINLDAASAGGTVTMNSTVLNNETVNANILLGTNITGTTPLASGNHSFNNSTNLGSGRTLIFGGNIAGIATGTTGTAATAGAEVLSLNGPGAGVLSGNISNGGASTFQVSVNSGIWTLSGNNTFAGPTFTQEGVTYTRGILMGNATSFLRIGSSGALGNGVLNITNGSATLQAVNGNQTVNRDIATNTGGFIVSGANSLTTSGRVILGGTGTITNNIAAGKVFEVDGNFEIRNSAGARTATFNGSGTTVLAGSVINNNAALTGFTSTGSVTYAGTGALVMSGANTYTGATVVSSGTLTLDYSTNAGTKISGTGTGAGLTMGGATLNLNGGSTATAESPGALTLNIGANAINQTNGSTSTIAVGTLTRNAGSTLAVSAGGIVTTTSAGNGGVNSLYYTGSGALGVVGGNDWIARGASTTAPYTLVGLSTVGGYTASTAATVANNANTDVTGNVTLTAAGATQTLRFNTANALTINQNSNALNLTQGGILVTPAVGNNLTTISGGTLTASNSLLLFQNNTANGLTISSTIANGTAANAVVKSGAGLVTLSNPANTYTVATYLNQGTLNIAADASLGTAPAAAAAAQLTINGGTLQFGADNITINANRGVTLLGNGGTMDTNSAAGSTVAGVITGAGNFTKVGAGTLTLNPTAGPNTYTGATLVNNGVLSLNRAGANSGTAITSGTLAATPITVGANGSLLLAASYTTNTTSTMTLGGGNLSLGNGVLQGQGATVTNGAATGTSLVGAGLLTLTANSSLNFQGTSGTMVFSSFDPTNFATGNFLLTVFGTNFGSTVLSADGTNDRLIFNQLLSATQLADINFNVNGVLVPATEFQLGTSGFYEVVPSATAVPEPSTWVLLSLSCGFFGYRAYRRKARRAA